MEESLLQFLEQHQLLAPFLFVLLRTVPVVVAPIPGFAVDFAGVAMFGWKIGFALALIGTHLGAIIAFGIGRYFREPVVKHFAPLRRVHEWENKYSEQQKFWMLVAVRFITCLFFDYVSYAAGLTKMSLRRYILSTFIGVTPLVFSVYYFGGLAFYQGSFYAFLFFLGILILGWLFGDKVLNKLGLRKDGAS